jgi:hypothetical protein
MITNLVDIDFIALDKFVKGFIDKLNRESYSSHYNKEAKFKLAIISYLEGHKWFPCLIKKPVQNHLYNFDVIFTKKKNKGEVILNHLGELNVDIDHEKNVMFEKICEALK